MNQPSHISLIGTEPYVSKIEAIKEARRVADWPLRQAKETVDAVLYGASRIVPLVGDTDAEAVAQRFVSLGFVVEVGSQRIASPRGPYRPAWSDRQRGAVQVTALHDLRSTGSLRVEARLISGSVDVGDGLGLPLNGSTIVVLPIGNVDRQTTGLVIDATAGTEGFEFWSAVNVIGEELPILESDES